MQRDIGDIMDRASIAKLKAERIGNEENKKEHLAFTEAIESLKKKYPSHDWYQYLNLLVLTNSVIWSLEAGLKGGKDVLKNPHYIFDKDNKEDLSQIGVIAILIRDVNSIRVAFKNILNKTFGTGFIDIKKNHGSELKENNE